MNEQGRNLIIGVFFIAAICIAVWTILFMHPTVGNRDQVIRARFTNIEQMKEGTRVTYAGRPMGEVVKITPLTPVLAQKADKNGNFYVWELELAVDGSLKVHTTDEIAMRTSGLFGERDVAILPRKPKEGQTPELITTQVVYAEGGDQMESAFSQIAGLATKMGDVIEKFGSLIDDNSELFNKTLESIRFAACNFGEAMKTANDEELIQAIKESFEGIGSLVGTLEADIEKLDEGKFFENLAKTSENIEQVTADIKDGKGTLGKLIVDDGLYMQVRSMMGKGETLVNDINRYGFLFHANRNWKRERARRQFDDFGSPLALRDYFDEEIDRIQTTLARVQEAVDTTECECPPAALANNPCFVAEFKRLLMQIEHLQMQLESYNERLSKAECRCL